jgi:hypothetical protein
MRRLLAAVVPSRPFPLVSLLAALLLTAADLATGAGGGLLLLAAFIGACALAIADRVRRTTAASAALHRAAAVEHTRAEGRTPAHDGGIGARLGSLNSAGKGGQ